MGDTKLKKILKKGYIIWNKWRTEDHYSNPDLSELLLNNYDLSNCNLAGALFQGAKLQNSILSNTNIGGANFNRAFLFNCNLNNSNCEYTSFFKSFLSDSTIIDANLLGSNLIEATLVNVCLEKSNLADAKLCSANLTNSNLRSTNLSESDLKSCNLMGADLRFANLAGADLRFANLSGADLRSAKLIGADLRSANLTGANLRLTDCSMANLGKTLLRGANISNTKLWNSNISGWIIDGIKCDSAVWDEQGKQIIKYSAGEFERQFQLKLFFQYPTSEIAELSNIEDLVQLFEEESDAFHFTVEKNNNNQGNKNSLTIALKSKEEGKKINSELSILRVIASACTSMALSVAFLLPKMQLLFNNTEHKLQVNLLVIGLITSSSFLIFYKKYRIFFLNLFFQIGVALIALK